MRDATPQDVLEGRARWCVVTADCLEVLPTLPRVDAVVTDPPYGVGFCTWDSEALAWLLPMLLRSADGVAITPGIQNLFDWPRPDWIAQYSFPIGFKRGKLGFNAWEPVLLYGFESMPLDSRQFAPVASERIEEHPCPKPLAPFSWLVESLTEAGQLILDPFCGSGTTGVACLRLGRRFIGIERDSNYAEIARDRLEAGSRGQSLREYRAGQQTLFGEDK